MAEFPNLVEDFLLLSGKLLLLGHFNIQVEQSHVPETWAFVQLIDSFGLHNMFHHPTHQSGQTLDILPRPEQAPIEVKVKDCLLCFLSDHYAVS